MRNTDDLGISGDPEMLVGKEINGITLIGFLGRGSAGVVYTAYQKSLKRKVALKLFSKQGLSSESIEKFKNEAETVAVLNHPNIVPVFDMGETEDLLFIVMQLIDGGDMRSMIQRFRRHPVPSMRTVPRTRALKIMIAVLDALEYAHGQEVIHQDVKPANIIIEENNDRPYLVDFGIARTFLSEPGVSGSIQGTPLYMAPEQAAGQPTDARADIYAAGVVLYETLSGSLPVKKITSEEMIRLKIHDPDSFFICKPSDHTPAIDEELGKIICKSTASMPSMRYPDCAGFKEDLVCYANSHQERKNS